MANDVVIVRFKDDYRILAKSEAKGRVVVKSLQAALKEYRLELNDDKTEIHKLPNGLFRKWRSQYHAVNPHPKAYYQFKRFQEVYLSVIEIDKHNSGCGVIDRFLADIVTKKYKVRIKLDNKTLTKVISLLLMLAELRTKAFPKVLAIIEYILKSDIGSKHIESIIEHLQELLKNLSQSEMNNRYLISWIIYFFKANNIEDKISDIPRFSDPIISAIHNNNFSAFDSCEDFKIFLDINTVAEEVTLLEHLDVFKPQ